MLCRLRRLVVRPVLGHKRAAHGVAKAQNAPAAQTAGDGRAVAALSSERTAVQAAAGGLHHGDAAVLRKTDRLRDRLPVFPLAVGRAMIEDIPLPFYADQAAMAVSHGIGGVHQLSPPVSDVTGGVDRPLVNKALVGEKAHGIVEARDVRCGVNQVIPASDMADGGTFPVIRLFGVEIRREKDGGIRFDGQHIPLQLHHEQSHDLMSEVAVGGLPAPYIEIDAAIVVHQNCRIKYEPVFRPGAVDPAVRETHVAQIRIFSCRGIAHGDRSDGGIGNRIIQIIAPIRPADYVRRVIGLPVPVPRGLLFSVNDPLVAPVAEIVFRG